MQIRVLASLVAVWSARLTAAETIVIEGGNTYFKPSSVNASIGDVLEFHFLPNNHSVVMGDLSSACQPASTGGFYSGFLPASSGENVSAFKGDNASDVTDAVSQPQVFRVTINDTDPFVYYCSQNASSHNHCKSGMFGFVNQPDQGAIDTYSAAAKDSSINISPDTDAFGGTFSTGSNTTATATANTTVTTSTPTATQSVGSSSTATASGLPKDNSGSGVKASGLFAIAMALILV